MSAPQKWKIHLAPAGGSSSIECDGEQVKNARAIKIESAVDKATVITVQYINCAAEIEIDGDVFDVTPFGAETRQFEVRPKDAK